MKDRLFRLLYPKHDAAKDLEAVRLEYQRKCSTLQRSPLDESVWMRKFVTLDADYQALDADYQALEKEVVELRMQNLVLWRQINALLLPI